MIYKEYVVNGEMDLNKIHKNYIEFSKQIQDIIPLDKDFKIQEFVENIYKKNRIERACMKIKITIGDEGNNHQEEFNKIKTKLEEILGHKVKEVKI